MMEKIEKPDSLNGIVISKVYKRMHFEIIESG